MEIAKYLLLIIVTFIGIFRGTCIGARVPLEMPIRAIYLNSNLNWNDPSETFRQAADSGYNVILLAFYLSDVGAYDAALLWENMSQQAKQDTLDYVHSKNAIIMVSAGGATDNPYHLNPVVYGTQVANFAVNNLLDGVDYDLENFERYLTFPPMDSLETVEWLSNVTIATKSIIGQDRYLTFAPIPVYFGPATDESTYWSGIYGGFTSVYLRNPSIIDFFFLQAYNQGSCYTTFDSLYRNSFGQAGCPFMGTSVLEISSYGIPQSKLVIGKPMLVSDASNGYNSPQQLNSFFHTAQSWDYIINVMTWQHHSFQEDTDWLNQVYNGISFNASATTGIEPSTTGSIPSTTGTSTTGNVNPSTTGTIPPTCPVLPSTTASNLAPNCQVICTSDSEKVMFNSIVLFIVLLITYL